MFRLQGGEWVAREVVKDVQSGRARFILNTGDMVWWGKQGPTPSENPYWRLVYEDVLKQRRPRMTKCVPLACQVAGGQVCWYLLHAVSALLGALLYLTFRVAVRVDLQRASHWQALGLFALKKHFVAIGLALLPACCICWREKRADKSSPTPAAALTLILAFNSGW